MKLQKAIRTTSKFLSKNSPIILTGLGVAGVIGTTILAIKVTPKAKDILDKEKEKLVEEKATEISRNVPDNEYKSMEDIYYEAEDSVKISKKDIIKMTWKLYVPVALSAASSIACIIGSHAISSKRNAALASLYSLSTAALKEYKDEMLNLEGGKEKVKTIQEKLSQKKVDEKSNNDKKPIAESENEIISTGNGDVLCMESITGRLFKSDKESIRMAVNDLMEDLINSGTVISFNDWTQLLGLRNTSMGDFLGWNMDNTLDVQFDSCLTENGKPCLVINYTNLPQFDFEYSRAYSSKKRR